MHLEEQKVKELETIANDIRESVVEMLFEQAQGTRLDPWNG